LNSVFVGEQAGSDRAFRPKGAAVMSKLKRGLLMGALRQIVGIVLFLSGTAGVAAALNPVPLLYELLIPDSAKPGGAAFTLTVNGAEFVSGAVVRWNGSPRTTTFVSQTQLKASILASDIAKAGTASITVANPAPGGGISNHVSFPVTPASTAISFYGSSYPVGNGPWDAGVGDFNGDGKLDLAVPNNADNTVSILAGKGDGTFSPLGTVATGLAPQAITVADLNADGKLDLAVANQGAGTVTILLGKGDGTFTRQDYVTGPDPQTVAVADFNGDGKLDLAVSDYGPPGTLSTVSILLGNGDGTFQPQVAYPAGESPIGVLVGDFNRDGKLDLAVVDNSGYLSILLGKGDGTFGSAVSYTTGANSRVGVVADLNGDGKLDLAIANYTDSDVSILFGNGDGSFQAPVNYSVGGNPADLRGADFNGDGRLDLVTSNWSTNSMSVLLGNGDGTFQAHIDFPTGTGPQNLGIGDFNGDGRLDVALADNASNTSATVSVLLQGPSDSVSKSSLAFAGQVVGTSSATQTVTITNTSSLFTLTIGSIAVTGTNSGDFSQTHTCSSLAPGASCTIGVAFKPTQVGPRTAGITITGNIPTPQSIPLSGTGVVSGANVTLSTTTLTFPAQAVGATSPAQTFTLINYGSLALSIGGITIKGADPADFLQTDTCGASIASAAGCTISVTFTPTAANARTASLSIADNATGSPQTVSLTGTGASVELNPTSLSFGVIRATTSKSLSTTLTNAGSTTVNISAIAVTGTMFSQTNTCGSSVGAAKSCTITVTFHPTTRGGFSGTLSVSNNGGGSPQTVSLSGSGCVVTNGRCKVAPLASPAARSALAMQRTAITPSPAGPARVGTLVMGLADGAREDPILADGTRRELLVRFWYPASLDQNCKPAEYTSARVWDHFARLSQLSLPAVTTNSCLDAPVADGGHPVVVFTHGYTGTFTDYTFLFEDLASRGYVVASIDHTYEATAVEFPDGRLVTSVLGSHLDDSWQTDEATVSRALSARLDDLAFVMNELEALNDSAGNQFAGKLDLTRVALAGHSLGGLTTWLGVQRDPRFKAAVLLDPYLADFGSDSTETPVLLMTMGREKPSQDECRLWSDLHGPRFWVNLRGAEHATSSDAVWLAKGAIQTGSMGPEKTIDAIRQYIVAFLEAHLDGSTLQSRKGLSLEFPKSTTTTQDQPLCGEP
jgi:dienelactone hydrolase